MSKTFKSAKNTLELTVARTSEDLVRIITQLPDGTGRAIDLSSSDAPALALAILEATAVVNSVEELDKLPLMTILCDFHGYRAEKWAHGFKLVGSVGVYSITLPARVLYRPTEELTNGR